MELQPFNPRHAPLVASWMPDVSALRLVEPLEAGPVTPDLVLRWMERAEFPFMLLPGAEQSPIGYAELSYPRSVPGLYARHVVIDPQRRGSGSGWTLLERLGHVAHARFGEEWIYIQVELANDYAVALLKAMGFAEMAPITLFPPGGGMGIAALTLGAPLPLPAYRHRTIDIPEPSDGPGYGRGLRGY